jgi:hypothetical protein
MILDPRQLVLDVLCVAILLAVWLAWWIATP